MTSPRGVDRPRHGNFLEWGHPVGHREPAMGYAARLAALSGVDLWTLVHDMRIPVRDLARGDAGAVNALADLRALGEEDRYRLGRYTPNRTDPRAAYGLAGHLLPPQMILTKSTKVCPHCVAEDIASVEGRLQARPWQRVEWTLAHVHSCARHGTMLIEVSPSQPLHVGHDFSKAVAERVLPDLDRLRAEAVPAPGAGYLDWLTARLDGLDGSVGWLKDVSLHAGILFCEALGISVLHSAKTRPSSLGPVELCQAIHEGFSVASGGPQAMRAAFDTMARTRFAGQHGSAGQLKVYGHLYRVLDQTKLDPGFDPLRDVLREHAFETLPYPAGRTILGVKLGERRLHTVTSAAKVSARANHSLRRMLAACTTDAVERNEVGLPRTVLSSRELDALSRMPREHLHRKDVAGITGFTIDQVDILVEKGWLPLIPESERPVGVHHRYLRSGVDALMGRLFRNAEPVGGPEGCRMTVDKARKVTRTLNTEILELVHDGKLAWVGRHGDGRRIANLLVDAEEVRAVLRPPTPSLGLTGTEAAKLLPGMLKSSVPRIARAGLLACIHEYRPECLRTVRLYTRESVEAFAREYITAGEVAVAMGRPPRHAVWHLANAGVREVLDYATVKTKIYRRRDVSRHLPKPERSETRSGS